jgi:uncharacterized protein YycO
VVGKRRKATKIAIVLAVILITAFSVIFIAEAITESRGVYKPDYDQIDIYEYLSELAGELTEEAYDVLFRQTGLGKDAVDMIVDTKPNPAATLTEYQENFFNSPDYACFMFGVGTKEERLVNEDGEMVYGFQIADIRNGDILLTKCTHSLGWRHGHAGIVIDAETGSTFEAMHPGTTSTVQRTSKWRYFPSFIQLRYKDPEVGEEAAMVAVETFTDVYWRHYAGIFPGQKENPTSTHCSHLVWYAYYRLGYDLNSDGLWPITPKDIANSEHLEIVQIFGVDPDNIW